MEPNLATDFSETGEKQSAGFSFLSTVLFSHFKHINLCINTKDSARKTRTKFESKGETARKKS